MLLIRMGVESMTERWHLNVMSLTLYLGLMSAVKEVISPW